MKKLMYLIVVVVALGLIVAGCLPTVPPTEQGELSNLVKSNGKTWYVPSNFAMIQNAIDSSSVQDGDTIIVAAGTYNEVITVNKRLTIQSSGTAADTIIDASNTDWPPPYIYAVTITANDVTFKGFTVKYNWLRGRKWCGIKLDGACGCTISDNVGDVGGDAGIYLENSANNNLISRNILSNLPLDNGIYVYESDGNEIEGNVVSSLFGSGGPAQANGIFLQYADNNPIHGNTANSEYKGININIGCESNKVYKNELSGNTWGIYMLNGVNNEIYDNNAISSNNIGIYLGDSNNNKIYGNLVTGNTEKGIYLFRESVGPSGNEIYDNEITSNAIGIRLAHGCATDNTMNYNEIYSNTAYGISSEVPPDATKNWWGHPGGPLRLNPDDEWAGPKTADRVSHNVDYHPWLHKRN